MNALLWRCFLVLLVLLPLPFGSYRPLAWSLEGLAVALLMGASTTRLLLERDRLFWRAALWPPLILVSAVVAWVLVQAFWPAPDGIAHPLWRLAAGELHMPLPGRISIAPQEGLVLLLRLLTSVGVFWISLQFGRERERALELLRWLGWAAAAYALYGLLNYIGGNGYLLWYRRWAYAGDITGTFVNRNTYATYAGIGLVVLTGLFGARFQQAWRGTDVTLSAFGRRSEALTGAPLAALLMAIVVGMALLQSHSRMGVASSLVGLVVLLLLMRRIGLLAGRGTPIVAAAFAVLLLFFSGGSVMDRFLTGELSGRPALIATAERIIASAPLLGSGYGAFPAMLPTYRDTTLGDTADYIMAHNSYLETAVELGIPATLGLIIAMAWLAGLCGYGVISRTRDRIVPTIALSAAILVGVHALLDFSIQIPAVQYTLAALLGVGVAQSFRHGVRTEERGSAVGRDRARSDMTAVPEAI